MPRIHLGDWVDSGVDWLQRHLSWLFDAISSLVTGMYDGIDAALSAPAPLLFAGILAVVAWWLRGLLAGVLAFAGFALIDSIELWEDAMSTLSLVLVATLVTLVIAVPLGIWASRSRTVSTIVRPVLDFMQTMPAMVYLIPGIIFFGVGVVPGIIATIIFALPPGVRMTELGIRQVDEELVEAAEAFGTTPRSTLLRVQLPLALPTIMAGINQVIMLGLSMVVIAGMVGGGGLGGAVYRAIGNVDIGLGFEAGVSIVILAMYLDRMTGALGRQVSPLGRRALAKARAMAGGPKIWDHRPQPAVAIAGIVVLALVAGGMGMFSGAKSDTAAGASRIGDGKKVSIGYIPWDEGIASTFLWKELLEQRGFEVDTKQLEAGSLYTGLAGGQIDFQTDAWLPVTHASYMEKYGDKLEDLGSWYGPTSLELSVPSYMKGVDSLEDLKGRSAEFKGRIVGIEPSAGMMGILKDKVLKDYGLEGEYKVVDGSTPGMLAELKRAYDKKEPIVTTLWSPHWAYSTYDLKKLKDPKGSWGKGDGVHTLARKGFSAEYPEVGAWLKNFKMTEEQLTGLEAKIQDTGKGKEQEAVRAWLGDNPGLADTWAPAGKAGKAAKDGKDERDRPLNVAWFPWEEDIAATYLWKAVLEERGYTMNLKQFEVGPMYTALSRGQIDVQFDGWLPTTQKKYWDEYGDKLTDLGSWYGPTSLELAVPSYVDGVDSLADLKGRGDDFKGRIVGIEPGTETMNILKNKVLPDYGLEDEFEVVDSSTPGMLAELKRAYAKKEPIAVMLWTPHWAYSEYDLTKLADPKKSFGEGDEIHTVASKDFPKQYPRLTKWFKDFKLSEKQLAGLENEIQKHGTGHEEEAVKAWMETNPGIADEIAPR
ncbi:ABC transporter permease/substrate binding protein [Streptomyces pristinaespiralis]|uniref:Glycine betaine ABC transport system permease n=3 Tax=Streptomyces pristinaespiralis TaxID=38300 RepID=B5H8I4_STRE2|nr:ABC transporter permease/substrate binding protein [Streptomyces pristinaespiralis]ALC24240.1 glycine/betaine ABC transporter permease [Streptomyces pristinaespiralis]EDY63145.1 glycine betaine ABC transport system permease [Streptomyces pristinaespiralis ATCC 25486]QMU13386.1 ABC transporter permease/substrate binding protein [Streptomyces pristinaespiralis]